MVGSHTLPPPTSSIKSIKSIKAHGHGQALHTCEYNEVRGVGTILSDCLCRSHRATPPASRPTCRRSPSRADLDNRTPTIIVLPVSCPVVPLGPSQWRMDGGERGRWHKSRHQRARDTRVFVQHATPARRKGLHMPRASPCSRLHMLWSFGPSVCGLRPAVPGLACRRRESNKGPPDAKRIVRNK
jgi:hypothetical protein